VLPAERQKNRIYEGKERNEKLSSTGVLEKKYPKMLGANYRIGRDYGVA
jgi:hypothetical protein